MPPHKIDRKALPTDFPTHTHSAEFWVELGRTVATFGFLEEVLVKAYFAITGTTSCELHTDEEAAAAVENWSEQLALAMADTLTPLAEKYAAAVRRSTAANFSGIGALEDSLKAIAKIRNAVCHGSWGKPDSSGASTLFYFSRPGKKVSNLQKFETRIDIPWLKQLRAATLDLACDVIDSVTATGYQFPSSYGPGEPIGKSTRA
ncbi:hypothetical protein [Hydrogenophaga sp. RWCD_12]|uniref:hypothetical protein n=1 Tax=Hydrogenophaga sp. RWCD_12 TaxID=3391190 RepID=UPI0039854EC6